jgi:glycosyltransferase involved in cell wall biosynthesis
MAAYSIIIPCFNPPLGLFQNCMSVLLQASKTKDLQVIVLCTGADKQVEAYLKSLSAPCLQVLYEEDHGVCHSRNKGLSLAKGRRVIFCDADDAIDPALFDVLDAKDAGQDILAYGFYKHIGKDIQSIVPAGCSDYEELLLQEGGGLLWNKAFLTSFLKEHALYLDESLKLAEDLEYLCRMKQFDPSIGVIEQPLHHYFVHHTSVSQRYRQDLMEEYAKSMQKICQNGMLSQKAEQTILARHGIYGLIKQCFHPQSGSFEKQKQMARQLLESDLYHDAFQNYKKLPLSFSQKMVCFLGVHHAFRLLAFLIERKRT